MLAFFRRGELRCVIFQRFRPQIDFFLHPLEPQFEPLALLQVVLHFDHAINRVVNDSFRLVRDVVILQLHLSLHSGRYLHQVVPEAVIGNISPGSFVAVDRGGEVHIIPLRGLLLVNLLNVNFSVSLPFLDCGVVDEFVLLQDLLLHAALPSVQYISE